MNERIRQLAVEATKYSNTLMIDYLDLSDEDYKEKYNQEYNKKFAQLIVRECSDKAHEFIIEDGDEFPKTSVAYRIKQHFGVEQ